MTSGKELTPTQWYNLAVAITYFETIAITHVHDEETSLFPRLLASRKPEVRRMIDRISALKRDHREALRHFHTLDPIVRRWLTNGTLDLPDFRRLQDSLGAIESTAENHLTFEDEELFPLASRVLSTRQVHRFGHEMTKTSNDRQLHALALTLQTSIDYGHEREVNGTHR
jgi:hemerythrin-like domain-containing protein